MANHVKDFEIVILEYENDWPRWVGVLIKENAALERIEDITAESVECSLKRLADIEYGIKDPQNIRVVIAKAQLPRF